MDAKSGFFRNSNFEPFEDCSAIIPLVTIDTEFDGYVFIGTAFYISKTGIIMTAKHNLFRPDGKPFEPLYIIHFEPTGYIFRLITKTFYCDKYDIAYLLPVEIADENHSKIYPSSLILTDSIPKYDEQLSTYGFPNSRIIRSDGITEIDLQCQFFLGKCRDYFLDGFSILKNPCFQTTILIKGGASGGPVFDKFGNVFALCSTGYELDDGEENISFVTPISPSFNILLEDGMGNKFTILELIEKQIIAFKKI